MPGADWHDPFSQDQEAVERERRRTEREARRREQQGSLGEKVRAGAAGAPETGEQTADADDSVATATRTAVPPPSTPERAAPAGTPPRPPRRRGPEPMLARRVAGALIVIAVLALLAFGVSKVIGALDGGPHAPARSRSRVQTKDLTIPEGLDRHQIAELAKKAGIKGDYEKATRRFKGFDPSKYGAGNPPNLEGFLFPATYELPKHATVHDLIERQLQAFEDNLAGVDMSYAKSKNLNTYDVLKIASMIEREVQVPKERPLVASVIYNRLAADNPLGIDATIRYEDQNYTEPLLESRLLENTPYNTRTHPGLPPTPIGNPGLDSIDAAANPAKTDYFYYVIKPGTCGEHVFTKTKAEFDRASSAYQQALEAQGGSPTNC